MVGFRVITDRFVAHCVVLNGIRKECLKVDLHGWCIGELRSRRELTERDMRNSHTIRGQVGLTRRRCTRARIVVYRKILWWLFLRVWAFELLSLAMCYLHLVKKQVKNRLLRYEIDIDLLWRKWTLYHAKTFNDQLFFKKDSWIT